MGCRTIAVARGEDKRRLALELGAAEYIDAAAEHPGQALAARGGARVILATAPSAGAIEQVLDGLGVGGRLLLVAAVGEPIQVSALGLIMGRRAIQGWPSGHAKDSEDTLAFAAQTGVRAAVEEFPLTAVREAFARMAGGGARFRVVLTMP